MTRWRGPATLAFGGALVMATGVLLLAGVSFAIASEQSSLDAVAAQALNVLSNGVWMPFIVGQAVFMLGAGVPCDAEICFRPGSAGPRSSSV